LLYSSQACFLKKATSCGGDKGKKRKVPERSPPGPFNLNLITITGKKPVLDGAI
jgi:hypothetical protein